MEAGERKTDGISDMLDPRCIELDISAKKKPEIIAELAKVLARGGKVADPVLLAAEVLEREKLASTGIGSGIAIPHVLSSTAAETAIAVGRKLDGAKFDSVDRQPVWLFILLAGPEGSEAMHLRVLSRLARYLHDRTFCQSVLDATSSEDVVAAFRRKEQDSP